MARQLNNRERNARYQRDWYEKNKDKKKSQVNLRRNRLRKEIRALILEYRTNNPCVDCAESDPVVLDFDHVRGVKRFNIAHAATQGYELDAVITEMAKCEIRCANCHRRKTHRERNNEH